MAILNETEFDYYDFVNRTSAGTHAKEVLAWLNSYAESYFDDIKMSDSREIVMSRGEASVNLRTSVSSSSVAERSHIYLRTGHSNAFRNDSDPYTNRFTKGIATDYGLVLVSTDGKHLFITKTNNSHTAVLWLHQEIDKNFWAYHVADLDHSIDIDSIPRADLSSSLNINDVKSLLAFQSEKTSLVPIVFDGGDYSPNLFWTRFTQSRDMTFRKIKLDGVEYLYDGVFALRV